MQNNYSQIQKIFMNFKNMIASSKYVRYLKQCSCIHKIFTNFRNI